MDSFAGKLAVVTGGASGIGRELVVQLAGQGCSVAACDRNAAGLAGTAERARQATPDGVRVTTHECDVADESAVAAARDEITAQHGVSHLDVLFSNAGVGGGGSFVTDPREEWEKTFAVCWGGVYNCARVFLPLLIAAPESWLVNTSSVNGFWATLGPGMPQSAYASAKFAVKGFSEALIEDLRAHAPHVHVAVVMPGHIGTDIVANSIRFHGGHLGAEMTTGDLAATRKDLAARGLDAAAMSDDEVRGLLQGFSDGFRDTAPMSAAQAATVILDAVRSGRWRILVGDDAVALDQAVRANPEGIYDPPPSS